MPASLTAARPQPTASAPLFSPFWLGQLRLPNRIVMAPLTRARADEHGVPSGLAAEYYAQRAGAGLIIAEATAVSRQGAGYDPQRRSGSGARIASACESPRSAPPTA